MFVRHSQGLRVCVPESLFRTVHVAIVLRAIPTGILFMCSDCAVESDCFDGDVSLYNKLMLLETLFHSCPIDVLSCVVSLLFTVCVDVSRHDPCVEECCCWRIMF